MFYCTVLCISSAPLPSLPSGGPGWVPLCLVGFAISAWSDLQSDHTEYKHFQCAKNIFSRIRNPDIQCGRIANPTERSQFREAEVTPTSLLCFVLPLHSPLHIISAIELPPFGRAGVGFPPLSMLCGCKDSNYNWNSAHRSSFFLFSHTFFSEKKPQPFGWGFLVGVDGFEPPTLCL